MARLLSRRALLQLGSAGVFSMGMPKVGGMTVNAEEISKQTLTYKTIGGCRLQADIFGAAPGESKPIAVWIHGGALIMGDRRGMDRRVLSELVKAGFVVVSIDYRLAPETKLPDILDDVRDAFAWVRQEGQRTFGAGTDRTVVVGGSAGGYLTLMSGILIQPRPRALVSFYGYGDIVGDWYSRPDPFYRRQPLVPEAVARASVGHEAVAEPSAQNMRFRFYLYCRQNGLWPKEVTGHDPQTEPGLFDRFCPVRQVTPVYPPTLLIHGTDDTDVPHEQSVLMDRELTHHGMAHEFISVKGAGHGLTRATKTDLDHVYQRVMAFLKQHTDETKDSERRNP